MRAEQRPAQSLALPALLQKFVHGDKIAEALRHLFLIDGKETVMQPEARQRTAVRCLGLGDFVFVVRKDEIQAAAVNVYRGPERGFNHSRALDMPAGPSRT